MRILVTQRVEVVAGYGERRDCLDQQWTVLLERLSMQCIPVPNYARAAEFASFADGMILTGGNDLVGLPEATNTAPERDALETELVKIALERGLPVLGVCRGLQFLNCFFGGTLAPIANHTATRHPLQGSFTGPVNSFHNFAVERLGHGLQPLASAPDGSVEAFAHQHHRLQAVMWHPERESNFPDLDWIGQFFRGSNP
ncbi:MAG: gamma-glutamyl-gamma-aminobutyrate hydrolase family protein [Candidatus Eremiobacteraeota bacterium]|nr:gamma-glutamyl-gamma-aminobutyrate hydrolase family protein [Candidatus Eremiobacteraeota bacterium]